MKALILVDLQNDFCPGGALPVKGGDQIIPLVNDLQEHFGLVVATQDWHPKGHKSFASNNGKQVGEIIRLGDYDQVMWPDHCVQESCGAALVRGLKTDRINRIFQKGTDEAIDSYSGFFDNGHKKATGLADYLKAKGISQVYIVGLATDYCVKFTALDAVGLGFATYLIEDAVKGVDLKPGDVASAIEEMKKAGVVIVRSKEIFGVGK